MTAAYPRSYGASRPAGVAILALLMGLVGVLLLVVSIAGIVLFTGLALLTQFTYFGAGAAASVLLFIFSIVLVVVAVRPVAARALGAGRVGGRPPDPAVLGDRPRARHLALRGAGRPPVGLPLPRPPPLPVRADRPGRKGF